MTESKWKLENKVIPKGTTLDNYDKFGCRFKEMYEKDFPIEVLSKDGVIWMSNTKMERDTNKDIVNNAKGDVLIAGLGMGWIIEQIQNKDNVKSIIVVEIDYQLIEFIKSKKNFNKKVTIINQDIWDFLSENQNKRYDVIWFDIWFDICPDNLIEMYTLEAIGEKMLNYDGRVLIWSMLACEYLTEIVISGVNKRIKNNIIKFELNKRNITIRDN